MNYKITPLFSVPLFHSKIGDVDPMTLAWIRNLEYPHEAAGHDHTDDKYILEHKKLASLKARIKESCDYFLHEVIGVTDDLDFEIQNSWINRHKTGEANTLHWHSNAMISGVYYPLAHPGDGDILFKRTHLYYNLFHDTVRPEFKEDNSNQYNTDVYTITPVSGDIILFPSHLEHMVAPNVNNGERYSLAFNLFARGTVGAGTSELKL